MKSVPPTLLPAVKSKPLSISVFRALTSFVASVSNPLLIRLKAASVIRVALRPADMSPLFAIVKASQRLLYTRSFPTVLIPLSGASK